LRHAAREHHPILESVGSDLRAQRVLLRTASDEQCAQGGARRGESGDGIDEDVQALVGVERADEADDLLAVEPEALPKLQVGFDLRGERAGIDGIGNDGDPPGGYAARDDVLSQALADRGDVSDAPQDVGLQRARRAVPDASFSRPVVIDGGILPERANLSRRPGCRAVARREARATR
jgi:hypothetical protein